MKVLTICVLGLAVAPAWAATDRWQLPVTVETLDNGLTVVVSEDHSSPLVGVSVVYKVGMRLEPRGRTGFAHLFEHLMFEGTPNAPKGTFDHVIEAGGGLNNGSTRKDYTNYIESMPVSVLEPILWLEADRMKVLGFLPETLKNQQDVVKEEIRINVKNQPYGAVYWIDIDRLAFDKWENAHDGYGSFEDLEGAKLEDVRAFHASYYGPNNAVIGIAGDVEPAATIALVKKYFAGLPSRAHAPTPDVSEGLNTKERTLAQSDPLAQVPALTVGWKMPPRGSADHVPAAVLAQVLVGDTASRLYQGLVKGRQQLVNVQGGLNWPLDDPWSFNGPTQLVLFGLYKPQLKADAVMASIDQEIATLVGKGVEGGALERAKTKILSDYYSNLEQFMNRADMLAKLQALWGDATVVNAIPGRIAAVTAADVQRAAKTYLTRENRSVIDRRPAAAATTGAKP